MMSNLETVKLYYEAWKESNPDKLRLAASIKHTSPMGRYDSRDDFLNACWGKSGKFETKNESFISQGNAVAARYEILNDGKSSPVCEWFTIENGEITDIKVYFGS
jgi:hypothetical protein